MKRFASLALALIMIFALAVPAFAEVSPTGVVYYNIDTGIEGSGIVDASANKVAKDGDETVTFKASDDEGYFTYWIIEGDYTIVSGSLTEDTITIIPHSDVKAVASFSKEKDYLRMTAEAVTEEDGSAVVDIPRVLKGSDTVVTFTATDKAGTFVEWEFKCAYKLVEGNTKTKVVKIIPYTDVHGIAYFKHSATPSKPDDSSTSPKTGDMLYVIIAVMALACGAVVFSAYKLKKG